MSKNFIETTTIQLNILLKLGNYIVKFEFEEILNLIKDGSAPYPQKVKGKVSKKL